MDKIPVYMMPGLAAGPKIFERIILPDTYAVYHLNWILPLKNESLQNYVKRLIDKQIIHDNPILLGVSFGGIVIQEMSKQIPVKKLILISTVKTHREFSPFLKLSLQFHLYKLFPSKILRHVDFIKKIAPTKNLKQKMKLYQLYLSMNQPKYLNWAIRQVLSWQQDKFPENFIHIAGENDRVFPIKYILEPRIIVPKARHDMIIFKAKIINKILAEKL